MKWDGGAVRFARPIRWLIVLLDGEVLPVTMPLQDAVDSLKINLASFIKPPKMLQVLNAVEIKAKSVVLVYIPFQKSGHDWRSPRQT